MSAVSVVVVVCWCTGALVRWCARLACWEVQRGEVQKGQVERARVPTGAGAIMPLGSAKDPNLLPPVPVETGAHIFRGAKHPP